LANAGGLAGWRAGWRAGGISLSESEKEEEDGRGRRKKQVTSKFLDFVMDPDEVSNGHGPQSPRKKGGANRDSLSRSSSENSRSRSPLEPQSVSEESC
ncbi:hypothetical protein DPMN_070046, partial [Dreissena polymorpha]